MDKKTLADMTLANAKQFAALYSRLQNSRKNIINFKPFELLSKAGSVDEELNNIAKKIANGNYDDAVMFCVFFLMLYLLRYCFLDK